MPAIPDLQAILAWQPLLLSPIVRVSKSKVEILANLATRKMTISELARAIKVNKAGVQRHVRSLAKSGLVERLPSKRKWVYYSLTEEGQKLLALTRGAKTRETEEKSGRD